jgi:hypothetical protein
MEQIPPYDDYRKSGEECAKEDCKGRKVDGIADFS